MNRCIVFVSGLNYFINNRANQEKRDSLSNNNLGLIWVKTHCVLYICMIKLHMYETYKGLTSG